MFLCRFALIKVALVGAIAFFTSSLYTAFVLSTAEMIETRMCRVKFLACTDVPHTISFFSARCPFYLFIW